MTGARRLHLLRVILDLTDADMERHRQADRHTPSKFKYLRPNSIAPAGWPVGAVCTKIFIVFILIDRFFRYLLCGFFGPLAIV